jgi:hypothetical protein
MPKQYTYEGPSPVVREFDQQNGGKAIRRDGNYFYPNGAYRPNDPLGGDLSPPPTNPQKCQQAIVRYWTHYVAIAAEEFYARRDELLQTTDRLTDDESRQHAEAELKALQQVVKDGRKSKKAAENELVRLRFNAPTVDEGLRLQREREEQDERSRTRTESKKSEAKKALKSIRI